MKLKPFSMFICVLCIACSKKKDPKPVHVPETAKLIGPIENEVCQIAEVISTTECKVSFDWSEAANTDNYELVVKNLSTLNSISYPSPASALTVTLFRGTPYSWYVVSKASQTNVSVSSVTWKFYTAGLAEQSYAPFPAEISSPQMGQSVVADNGKVTISWKADDPDKDLAGFELFLGNDNTLSSISKLPGTVSTTQAEVQSGRSYSLQIVSKDEKGNTAKSDVIKFKVN